MPPPTRVRYSVLGLLCLLAMITYMDRAMYGSAKGDMMDAVGQPESRFYLVLVFFHEKVVNAVAIAAFMLLVYIPLSYMTDNALYKWRQKRRPGARS